MRTKNSINNFIVGIGGQVLNLILGFVSRNIFLMFLSIEYLGASGLFSSILTMLSFAELGIGTAIIYSLYKPLADGDNDQILALMNLFKKVYRVIACVVFIAGVCILPFLDFFVTDRRGIEHLEIIYMLFVINTASSYLFSYNKSLITADQKAYRLVKIEYLFKVLHVALPIIGLAITRNYLVYLTIQIGTTILLNVTIYFKVNKEYPVLKSKQKAKITEETKKAIIKNVMALLIYKVAIVVTAGTDNILISRFFGLASVGIYSNYHLITQNLNTLATQGLSAVTASVGNLSATENSDKKLEIFNVVQFINAWIYSFCSIGLFLCLNPFIRVWLGKDIGLYDVGVIIPIVFSFYLLGMQSTTSIFREAQGLFWQGKLRPIAQALVNLGTSILLAKLLNSVSGIFWGTALSRLTTNFWFDPYIVFKHGIKKPVMPYFIKYAKYFITMLIAGGVCYLILSAVTISSAILNLLFHLAVCCIVPNAIFLLLYHKTAEFKYLVATLKRLIRKRK